MASQVQQGNTGGSGAPPAHSSSQQVPIQQAITNAPGATPGAAANAGASAFHFAMQPQPGPVAHQAQQQAMMQLVSGAAGPVAQQQAMMQLMSSAAMNQGMMAPAGVQPAAVASPGVQQQLDPAQLGAMGLNPAAIAQLQSMVSGGIPGVTNVQAMSMGGPGVAPQGVGTAVGITNPGGAPGYRDFSKMSSGGGSDPAAAKVASLAAVAGLGASATDSAGGHGEGGGNSAPGKEPPFPVKLHRILSNAEFRDVIAWLPHGRSWRVLKPKAFEERVIPLYFRHAKYASFMRQVNGWGFKRMTQGPDHNSYYHELFLRGLPHLCLKMHRPARSKHPVTEDAAKPDFYRLSMINPLPNGNGGGQGAAPPGGPQPGAPGLPSTPSAAINPQLMSLAGNSLQVPGAAPSPAFLASEILQQHIQGQLQQAQAANGEANKGAGEKEKDSGTADGGGRGDVFQQKIKERSELVRQLKEVMGDEGGDGSSSGGHQPPEQDSTAVSTAQIQQILGTQQQGSTAAGTQTLPNMMASLGQFQNGAMGQQLLLNQRAQQLMGAGAMQGMMPAMMAGNPSLMAQLMQQQQQQQQQQTMVQTPAPQQQQSVAEQPPSQDQDTEVVKTEAV